SDGPILHRFVHWRADADLDGPLRIDQPLLDRVIEWRAMAEALPEAVRPGIDMRVEMHQRQRLLAGAGARRERAQQRQRDGVIAAQRDQMTERFRLCFDRRQRTRDLTVDDAEIADI